MPRRALLLAALGIALAFPVFATGGGWTLIGWNNLGMHCMDKDYSVFSILPPYNTVHAQLIDASGRLVRNPAGILVTYEAVRDPAGSINTTSRGKTEFWTWVSDLFGLSLAEDAGLAGAVMPGSANRPQTMTWDATQQWFTAEGIPITPRDDAGRQNTYPMMRLVARDAGGAVLATTQVVLPVSDEMSCSSCHSSGAGTAARPAGGWVNDPNPEHDYRLNILRLHDERQAGDPDYAGALRSAGFRPEGLYATAAAGHPILCARCHPSNALPGSGITGIAPLTRSIHRLHGGVVDPGTGTTLESAANRGACYSCHPGSTTRCLRGAMGKSVALDGSLAMQCQSCHGPMSQVGGAREGWLDEPDCQSCHTGTAMDNAGRLRFTSAFSAPGVLRQAVDPTFATNPDVPASGFSLYRFSRGHGGLACEACHGSTHAEYPSSHTNDNVQSRLLQNHAGVLAECSACHGVVPFTVDGGPHGMHPIGPQWVRQHGDVAEDGGARQCRSCHGADDSGTVLSMAKGDWTASMEFGTRFFWAGFRIGCYACHNGPGSESATRNRPPAVANATAATTGPQPVQIALSANDPDGDALALRVVSQPAHGTVGLAGQSATYFPESGFSGTDTFTFAAWDGQIDSNLGTATVAVSGGGGGTCTLTCGTTVPAGGTVGRAVSFAGTAQATHCTGLPAWAWTFGDGGTSTLQSPTHAYDHSGTFDWSLEVTVSGQSCRRSGRVQITAGTPPPVVTRVSRLSNPFRVVIAGTGFHANMKVYIGDRLWTDLGRRGSVQVTLRKGSTLQALFPASTWVRIRAVNPDGQSVAVEFNRTANQWRPVS